MRLFVHEWGAALQNAPKLIFLHGLGGTGKLWRPIAASLEDRFSILAPDQRGHGQSQSNELKSYGPLDYGQDLAETIAENQFHPAVVIGHSMGVRTACALAHLKPEWVQGLVLVDLGFAGLSGGGYGEALANFLKNLPSTFESREHAREYMKIHCPDEAIAQYLIAVSAPTGNAKEITFPFDQNALVQTIQTASSISIRKWVMRFSEQGLPILALRGEKSQAWKKADFDQAQREMPGVQFEEFAGAGHGLPFEKRAQFVKRIEEFVGQISTS